MAVRWMCAGDLVVMETAVVGLKEKDRGRGPWSVEVRLGEKKMSPPRGGDICSGYKS